MADMNSLLLLLPLLGVQDHAATQDRFASVRDSLAQKIESGAYLEVVAAVEVKGQRVFEQAAGGLDSDAIFRIFSMTKPVTAVAAMTLVEEGKLDLDSPVSRYLPAFADQVVLTSVTDTESGEVEMDEVAVENPMTVRDLLRHTSGLTYGFFGNSAVDKLVNEADLYSGDLERFADRLGALPLKHQPGTRFEYSLSSDVLGRVVEVASGKPLDVVFSERIFEPLGMVDTGFQIDAEDLPRVATTYTRGRGGLVASDSSGAPPPTAPATLFLGGAGLFSTTDDYLRFCNMLLAGGQAGDQRILSQASVDQMLRDHLGERPKGLILIGSGFGLGLAIVKNTPRGHGPSAGTAWWGGAAGTGFWIDTERQITGVFMIQNMMELTHWHAFQGAIYAALDAD